MSRTLDWNEYTAKSAEVVSEGIVMLENRNNALPIKEGSEFAVFGRIQLNYYKSGTGSGGLVNVSRVIGITDGLLEAGANVNRELLDVYKAWTEENPYDIGNGWGGEPWSQKEMPVSDELAAKIAKTSDTAVAIIGRTAGEEQDSTMDKGSYLLSEGEEQMLETVRKHFRKVVVLLNVGGIIDMSFVKKYDIDAVLYVWQGGMVGGTGTADVILGKVSPSGKLPDTIAADVKDYPSDANFGDPERNFYCEDIYVGYRYFETFAKDRVLYPFGFGLSYTAFDIKCTGFASDENSVTVTVSVKNTGCVSGKEVVQVYCSAPQGKLGKPARVLCGFEKTGLLAPGEEQTIAIDIDRYAFSSYDDTNDGVSGFAHSYVLEKGTYDFYVGADVRSAVKSASVEISETVCVEKLTQALAPVLPFRRMKASQTADGFEVTYEDAPLSQVDEAARRMNALPAEIPQTGDKGYKLCDVKNGKCTMNDFIAQLSDNDLACIVRGEGMGSPKVTAGTASAFGGVSDGLAAFGIPCGCCSDGPSGMRLDCGTKAFSLPNGTLLAATFNKALLTELFSFTGIEMQANRVDCLLGPGMNIHRHPLNGRNFEYFSEDPFLTGMTAAAELKGMRSAGVTGTIKHFCGNNQETRRHFIDDGVSERALREIYLKGFEIAVKTGKAASIMTTYGSVNGLWTAGSYDLDTVILRNEWGFEGICMTDWWANINRRGCEPDKSDFAAMVMAQNDIYMVCADGGNNDDNVLASLEKGGLTRGELQRCAKNVCSFMLNTHAMDRVCGIDDSVKIIGRSDESEDENGGDVVFYKLDNTVTIDLTDVKAVKGASFVFGLDVVQQGLYDFTITASSTQSELAQIPVTLFSMGTPCGTFTWNGTGGKDVSYTGGVNLFSRYTAARIYFAQSGLDIKSVKFELKQAY